MADRNASSIATSGLGLPRATTLAPARPGCRVPGHHPLWPDCPCARREQRRSARRDGPPATLRQEHHVRRFSWSL